MIHDFETIRSRLINGEGSGSRRTLARCADCGSPRTRPIPIDLAAEAEKDRAELRKQLRASKALLVIADALAPLVDEEMEAFKVLAAAHAETIGGMILEEAE